MGTVSREQVTGFMRSHKQEFLEKYGVCKIGLFGSLLKGEQTEASDIDIAIEMVPGKKSLGNFLAFKRYLEREFGMPVDLGIESSLKPAVREAIRKEIEYV